MHQCSFVLLAAAAFAGSIVRADAPAQWRGTSTIQFSGTSTLHDWSGTVPTEPFAATVTMDENDKPVALKAQVTVKAVKMDTKEPDRDKKMRASMKVADFPLISGTFDTPFDNVMKPGQKAPSRLPFKLTLLGKEHPMEGVISNWSLKDDMATFDLDFDLSLKACGISVPSVLLVIRVGDVIKVHATVKLVRD